MRDTKGTLIRSLAVSLSISLISTTLPAVSVASPLPLSVEALRLPSRLGMITEHYLPTPNAKPRIVLIQDLHLHYPTQKRILGILNLLFKTDSVAGPVGVEGVEGVYDTSLLASYPAGRLKNKLVDYFMKKGELSGDEAFSILRGDGKALYGIEKASFYGLNRDLFRKTLDSRHDLKAKLEPIRQSLPYLKKRNPDLEKTIDLLERLLNQEVTLQEATFLVKRLPELAQFLNKIIPSSPSVPELEETLKSAIDFYIVAFMRDKPMAENIIALNAKQAGKSTAVITGGFHTAGLAKAFQKAGIGYVVVTPHVTKLPTEADRQLYERRLAGGHLTEAEFMADMHLLPTSPSASPQTQPTENVSDDAVAVRANLKYLRHLATRMTISGARTSGGGLPIAQRVLSVSRIFNGEQHKESEVLPGVSESDRKEFGAYGIGTIVERELNESIRRFYQSKRIPFETDLQVFVSKMGDHPNRSHAFRRINLWGGDQIDLDAEEMGALVNLFITSHSEKEKNMVRWLIDWRLHHELSHSSTLTGASHIFGGVSTFLASLALGIFGFDSYSNLGFITSLVWMIWGWVAHRFDQREEYNILVEDFNRFLAMQAEGQFSPEDILTFLQPAGSNVRGLSDSIREFESLARKIDLEKVRQLRKPDEDPLVKMYLTRLAERTYPALWSSWFGARTFPGSLDAHQSFNSRLSDLLRLAVAAPKEAGKTADAYDIHNSGLAYGELKEEILRNEAQAIAYFEALAFQAAKELPEGLFGKGFGYDVRGNAWLPVVGNVDLTPVNCFIIGKALASLHANAGDKVLFTGDQRIHTPVLRLALALGAASTGVHARFSDEVFGTGEHGVLSGENPDGDVMMVQVSGSHGVPGKNGLKIKVTKQGSLEPLYGKPLAEVHPAILHYSDLRQGNGSVSELKNLSGKVVEYYLATLPEVDPDQPIVIDCRNSALIPALKEVVKRRGLKDVTWLNDEVNGAMPGGIWDPSKPEAMEPTRQAVIAKNRSLAATGSNYRAVGFVFDGDGDRCNAVLEDGNAVAAFEMTLPFYQRFLSDPINLRVIERVVGMAKAEGRQEDFTRMLMRDLLQTVDIRANSRLFGIFKKYAILVPYYINTGYPPQRDVVRFVIAALDKFVQEHPSLQQDAQFMSDLANVKKTYFTAEASGHQFFHICPTYPEKVIDAGIAVMFNLLNIKATIKDVEAKDRAHVDLRQKANGHYELVDLFDAFPTVSSSPEIRISVPNELKFELEKRMAAKLRQLYAQRALPEGNGIVQVGDIKFQKADEGFIEVDGLKVQLKTGGTSLFRKSNTGEEATLMFEGSNERELVQLMLEMIALIKEVQNEFRVEAAGDSSKEQLAAKISVKNLEDQVKVIIDKLKSSTSPSATLLAVVEPFLANAPVTTPANIESQVEAVAQLAGVDQTKARQALLGAVNSQLLEADLGESNRIGGDVRAHLSDANLGINSFSTVDNIDAWVEGVAKLLNAPADKIRWILINAIQPTVFMESMTQTDNREIVLVEFIKAGLLPTVFSRYLLAVVHADPANKTLDTTIVNPNELIQSDALEYAKGPLNTSLQLPQDADAQVRVNATAWKILKYHFRVIRAESAKRIFAYRGQVMNYFNNEFMAKNVPDMDAFIKKNFTDRGRKVKYIVSSGIGANEEYTRQLARIHNDSNPEIRWIIVNNPAEWEEIRPTDASGDNTVFFDISRSGNTEETVKTFELSIQEFPYRIVAANTGPLRKLGETHNQDGSILMMNLRPDIGGRLMRRLTPMVYAPMYLAGMDVKTYAEATDRFDRALTFTEKGPNLAISMAELFMTMFFAGGRSQLALFANGATYESALYRSLQEVHQLWMEGGQKRGALLAAMQLLLLPHDSHRSLEGVLGQNKFYVAMMVLARRVARKPSARLDPARVANREHVGLDTDDVLYGLAQGNADRVPALIPTVRIDIEKATLETAAALSTLYEDASVYYTALTGQDPNANPEVAKVRGLGSKRLAALAAAVSMFMVGVAGSLFALNALLAPKVNAATSMATSATGSFIWGNLGLVGILLVVLGLFVGLIRLSLRMMRESRQHRAVAREVEAKLERQGVGVFLSNLLSSAMDKVSTKTLMLSGALLSVLSTYGLYTHDYQAAAAVTGAAAVAFAASA